MQIHPDVPAHQLDLDQRLLSVFVVLGPGHAADSGGNRAGVIKTVRFGPNVMSPLLGSVEWIRRGDRIVGVRKIRLSDEELRAGTSFLHDLYAEEGRPEVYDWYVGREKTAHRRLNPGKLELEDLPAKVREWQTMAATDGAVYPSAPKSAPKSESSAPTVRKRPTEAA